MQRIVRCQNIASAEGGEVSTATQVKMFYVKFVFIDSVQDYCTLVVMLRPKNVKLNFENILSVEKGLQNQTITFYK